MALTNLVTREQLEDFLSPVLVERCLDDMGAGEASDAALEAVLFYASSMLRGKIGEVTDLAEVDEQLRPEVTRIGLEICQARLALRCPEVMRMDGLELMRMAKRDLAEIRSNKASIGTREGAVQAGVRAKPRIASRTSRGFSDDDC